MGIHFKTASGYVRRSPFQAMAAVFVLSLTFFVATLVAILVYSTSQLLIYFETRPQVIAFIKDEASESDVESLRQKLLNDSQIKEVKYVSKSDALNIYKKATSDNPLLGELVSPTIFPASLEFSIKDLAFAQDVINRITNESIVSKVGFTAAIEGQTSLDDVVNRLRTITKYIRLGGVVFTGVLVLASFMVLLITITMRMVGRREEIEILKLIGATQSFIRGPIVLESIFYSMFGVFIGWVLAFIAVLYSAPFLVSYFGEIAILPRELSELALLFVTILGVELCFGLVLALAGSFLAISRVRKSK